MISRRKLAGIEFSVAEPSPPADTIIFMHGIGGDDTSFEMQSRGLAEHYRVIAWNMPGYRNSDVVSPVTFEALADALLSLLDALSVQQAHIAGQSIGGMVAQEFYCRYPKRVKSLLLIATTAAFGGKDNSFRDAFLKARLAPLEQGVSMGQLAQQAMPAIVGNNISSSAMQGAVEAMAALDENVYKEVLRCLVTFNRRDALSDITCPVCLIAGEKDTNAPASTMEKMSQKIPQAEYHVIEGAGHLVNTEAPDQCNQIVNHFLNKNFFNE